MNYIKKIIEKLSPVVFKVKLQKTKENEDIYQGYENICKIISEETLLLLMQVSLNGPSSIKKHDYKRVKNYCKVFKDFEKKINDCDKKKHLISAH